MFLHFCPLYVQRIGFPEGDQFYPGTEQEPHTDQVWLLSVLHTPCTKRLVGKKRSHFLTGVNGSKSLDKIGCCYITGVRKDYVWHPRDPLGCPVPNFDGKWTHSATWAERAQVNHLDQDRCTLKPKRIWNASHRKGMSTCDTKAGCSTV